MEKSATNQVQEKPQDQDHPPTSKDQAPPSSQPPKPTPTTPTVDNSPLDLRSILSFLKAHPPRQELSTTSINSILRENSALILAHQNEIRNGPSHRAFPRGHFERLRRLEGNMLRIVKNMEPRRIVNLGGIGKAKRYIQSGLSRE